MKPVVRKRGMTLIEVLLASVILGTGLTALLTAASRCLVVMRRSQEYQQAQWAMTRGELEFPIIYAEDIMDQGVSGEDYDGYTFSREVEDDEDEDGLYLVRSRVTWESAGREKVEEVAEYVYQPESEGDEVSP